MYLMRERKFKMLEWQVRQKHEEDYSKSLEETGIVKGDLILRFNGPEFWKMFRDKLGHSSGDYKFCDCKKKIQS